jgi:hypothetical protein
MRKMKSKKFRILILAIAAVLAQSTCAYAEGDKTTYTKEDLENIQPGFGWEDIYKSQYKVGTSVNDYSSTKTPKEIAEELGEGSSSKTAATTATETTTTDSASTPNTIVKTQPSTGIKGDYWGKTSTGKWMLFEQGVPVTGWKKVIDKWYYMDLEGIMQTGWLSYGENWYYLKSTGDMAYNTYADGYYLDWNGVMQ